MVDNSDSSNLIGEDDLDIDRSAIGCDWCSKPGPTKNCSRCMSYYYCNRDCQVKQWANHKHVCSFLKGKCDQYMEEKRKEEEEVQDEDEIKKDGECAICLEEIELPISLECGHVFCVQCLIHYQTTNLGKGSCPNCRGGIHKEIGKKTSEQMNVYIERAKRSHGAEREVYVNLALRQCDAALNNQSLFESQHYKDSLQIATLFTKVSVLGKLDMYREVIDTADEFMHLCANTHDVDVEWIIETRVAKANAHLNLEEWQTALDMFKLLYEDCKEQHGKHCSTIVAGISRAQYELHNYHEASVEGCRAAWRDNRYRAGVHKYIALSQMKLGDMAGAKKSITRGILQEEQWNEENLRENKEVLRMVLAEEVKSTKPKSKKKRRGKTK